MVLRPIRVAALSPTNVHTANGDTKRLNVNHVGRPTSISVLGGGLIDQLFVDAVFASAFDFVARITHALPITLPLLLAWSARCHESANCSSYSY